MKQEDVERLLAQTSAPRVVESGHRASLKAECQRNFSAEGIKMMPMWRKRAAWAACAVMALATAGWGINEVRKTFVVHTETVDQGNGIMTGTSVSMSSDATDFTEEKAKQYHEEIKSLIAQGKGELVKVDTTPIGMKVYVYRFTLSDGKQMSFGVSEPLDKPGLAQAHQEELNKLIADKEGEVVEVKQLESGTKVYICKVVLSDGTVRIYGSDVPPKSAK